MVFNHRVFPYNRLVKLQSVYLSKQWIQRCFYPHRMQLIKDWANKISSPSTEEFILTSLMANTGRSWRMLALNHPEVFQQWVIIKGIQILENAIQQKQGVVILCTHAVGRSLYRRVIQSCTPSDVLFLGGVHDPKRESYVMASYAHQIVEAQRTLHRGGIIQIAADGIKGKAYLTLPFHGHLFPFRPGFADLAVRTGAVVVAVFDYLELDGHITFEFVEMTQPSPGPREEQVDFLVRQYARILEEWWPKILPSLRWNKLRQVMEMPPVTE